ncbi:hypothetical protein DLM78_02965 [Leptospira stimsonii]|uniref:Uncharacterized protein n=1 Tax=Leptospira stimsonii TaxID=2202203 RepID=A0A8B6RZ66_9LEPT|nr:hypothetical protein DLM78_02965 [Leptospira stimsonii]
MENSVQKHFQISTLIYTLHSPQEIDHDRCDVEIHCLFSKNKKMYYSSEFIPKDFGGLNGEITYQKILNFLPISSRLISL